MVCKCIPECFLKLWMFIGGGVHILIGAVLIILALVLDGVDLFPPEMHDEMHSAFMGMLSNKIFTRIFIIFLIRRIIILILIAYY